MDLMTFGEKEEGKEYIWRPAVYGLIFNPQENKIAIIETSDGYYFLPGGGLEHNETHDECLKREAIEEMGTDLEVGPFIGCARRYFYSTNEYKNYLNEGHFYLCSIGKQICEPIERDLTLKWVEVYEAKEKLFHEHQRWAISEALRKLNIKAESEAV